MIVVLFVRMLLLFAVLVGTTLVALVTAAIGLVAGLGATVAAVGTAAARTYLGTDPERARESLAELRMLPPASSPSSEEADPGEPAYRAYFFGPVVAEFVEVLRAGAEAADERLRDWIDRVNDEVLNRSTLSIWRLVVFIPVIGADAGLILGGVLGGVLVVLVSLVEAVLLAVLIGLGAATGGALRAVELGMLGLRGITLECPNCHERVTRPVYRCSDSSDGRSGEGGGHSGCGAAHRSLVPGRLGIFRRVCRCGRSLPTLLALGKIGLATQCSHCDFQLPRRGFSAPTVHVPVAGGPQVGKSVFMFAAVQRLHTDHTAAGGPDATFWGDESFAATFRGAREGIADPDQMRKTTATRPKAYTVYVGSGRRKRLAYLYDTAGELYDDSGALAQAGFYTFTKGIVLCVDPFSLAGIRERVDPAALDRVRSPAADPKAALERVTENLRESLDDVSPRPLPVPLAVVVTKADALGPAGIAHPYADLPPAADAGARDQALRTWVREVGVRTDLVSSVTTNYAVSSFFVVSHQDAARGPGGSGVNDDPAAPVRWLLSGGPLVGGAFSGGVR